MIFEKLLASSRNVSIPSGTLFTWGENQYGELGDGTYVNKSSPVLISSPTSKWISVAAVPNNAGDVHAMALRQDKTLWAWGSNIYGQLGLGYSSGSYSSPVITDASISWSKLSFGLNHGLGIKSNGTLWSWGDNTYGQLGISAVFQKFSPTLVSGPASTSWSQVSAGMYHSLAITTTGRLYAWGYNLNGQVGDSSQTNRSSPVLVSGPASTSWSIVSGGLNFSSAITTTGQLYTWGYNTYGQLGDNTLVDKSSPVLVSGPASTSWSAIYSGGGNHMLATSTTGRLYAWGDNTFGQLGDNSVIGKSSPVLVSGPASTSWSAIAAGTFHSAAIATTGQLYAWGYNNNGQLGDSSTTNKSSPVLVSGPASTSWTSVVAGDYHSIAITSAGRLYAWGYDNVGQLGDNSTTNKSSPVLVSGPVSTSWSLIATSGSTAGALTNASLFYAWGSNLFAQTGLGGAITSPVQTAMSNSWNAVDIGRYHTLAIDTNGRLWAWGRNNNGQLGDLTVVDKNSPVLVSGPATTSWSVISAGLDQSLAIDSTGRLWAWGLGTSGQLGYNSTTSVSSPVLVSGPASTSWSAVSGGEAFSMGITSTGQLYGWGVNSSGQLGILITTAKSSPVLVSGPASTSWSSVFCTTGSTLAITSTGQLYAWGLNNVGQLGDLSITNKSSPVLVSGPASTSWSVASMGYRHTVAITTTGQLYAWGFNSANGPALGDNSTTGKSSPILVSGPAATSWSAVSAGYYYNLALVQ